MTGHDRDLTHGEHLDAETLAAWVDGGLDTRAAAMAESHVSGCDRCQEIIGLMSRAVVEQAPEPWFRRFRAGWLIPLTAGVAAVGLWMIVPANRPASVPTAPQQASTEALKEAPAAAAEPPAEAFRDRAAKRQQQAPAVTDQLAKAAEQEDRAKNRDEKLADRAGAREDRFAQLASPAPTAPAAAAAAAAAPQALGRSNETPSREIASPDSRTRWRLLEGGNVEYSSNSGETWEATSTGVTEQLTAGSSPASDVCWIVGKNGTVLLTTDGRQWRRIAFPEVTDLSGVQTTDSRSALVIAADGMLFRTLDGGATWTRP